jgi:hypothetical protein
MSTGERDSGVGSVGLLAAPPLSARFELGTIVKPLAEQFAAQDLKANPNAVALWQARMEAIVTLRFGDVLTWSQAQKAYDRLGKQIWAGLRSAAKSESRSC